MFMIKYFRWWQDWYGRISQWCLGVWWWRYVWGWWRYVFWHV